ncbi:MAG: phenylalanine 4-monooxygenase [Sphingomonadales bacterium]|nr:MAG: phenylalanine 4-monooxygenase [Sphingomonadales bacterium]
MAATHIFDKPPEGVAADWTMPQNWAAFTAEQHATWRTLFDRQSAALGGYACRSFLDGLDILRQLKPGVPDFAELNALLKRASGWEVVAVPGWIPNQPFFEHLANKRFPAANFVRPPEQIAYSEEPDMFHDIFGHIPMLTDPAFSDFLVAYGLAGLRAEKLGASDFLGRLWLYTVEFGLVVEDGELRAFGGGLMSSFAETLSALTAPEPQRIWLDIERVMRTRYNFDEFQQIYFVVAGFEELLRATEETDFASVYRKIAGDPSLEPGDAYPGDLAYEGRLSAAPTSGEATL